MQANWFVGLPVRPGSFLKTLSPPPLVRLFGEDDLHITVAFLGRVSEEQALAAFSHAASCPLVVTHTALGEVRAFGNPRRPSALSALPTRGKEDIERAMGSVRDVMCDAAGARPETRAPLAHVTIARPSRKALGPQLRAAVAWAEALDLGRPEVCIDSIALYTWAEDRSRGLFRIVRSLPLPSADSKDEE